MTDTPSAHPDDPHYVDRMSWLRAAVLGANDGIVSVGGLITGVAAASSDPQTILIAGAAGLVAGAMSMAAGEYVSVSSQTDIERADIARERAALEEMPEEELHELAGIYESRGMSPASADFPARIGMFCLMVAGAALLWGGLGKLTQTGSTGAERLQAVQRIAALWLGVVSISLVLGVLRG